jgi:hypothetical protein
MALPPSLMTTPSLIIVPLVKGLMDKYSSSSLLERGVRTFYRRCLLKAWCPLTPTYQRGAYRLMANVLHWFV